MTATAEPTIPFQPPERDCVLGDPDDVIERPHFRSVDTNGGDSRYLPFARDNQLAAIADGLIERFPVRYGPLEKIAVVYAWTSALPDAHGDVVMLKLKKADDLLVWFANEGRLVPTTPDVFVLLNAQLAGWASLTMWQAQAAIHTALECVRVKDGKVSLLAPQSSLVGNFIARRYGAWSIGLQAAARAMQAAVSEQLPLFEEETDEEGAGDDDNE